MVHWFYTVGKHFCLRGGQEHRNLTLTQFRVRLYQCFQFQRQVKDALLASVDYHKVLKLETRTSSEHVRPLEKFSNTKGEPWYSATPIGKNTLQNMVKRMCNSAGIPGNKTNNSLGATGATALFKNGEDRTGHRSLVIRTYERWSKQRKQFLSTTLKHSPSTTYRTALFSHH